MADPARRFVSVGTKLAVGTALVVTLISGLVLVELTQRERENLVRAKEAAAANVADLFALEVAAPLDFGDADAAGKELEHLAKNRDVVYAAAYLAKSEKPFASTPTSRAEVDAITVERPIVNLEGKQVGRAVLQFSIAPENAAYRATRARIFALWLALTTLTVALLTVLARRQIVKPLTELTRAARRLERGEEAEKLLVASEDEIGRLARSFEKMQTAIVDREKKLASANRELQKLYDSMAQGIVAIDERGVVVQVGSRRAPAMFCRDELEGAKLADLLYPEGEERRAEIVALEAFIDLAFAAPVEAWDDIAENAPKVVSSGAGDDERRLELEFRPIAIDDRVARLMVLVTDATEKQRLLRKVDASERARAEQIAAMRRLVSVGGQSFAAFLARARERLDRCEEIGASIDGEKRRAVDEMLEHAHSIKGEARVFDLASLGDEMALLEDKLREVSGMRPGPEEARDAASARGDIAALIAKGRAALDRAEEAFVAASPLGKSALDQTTVRRQDVARLVELTADRDDEIAAIASRLAARPFGESASILADKVPTWAEAQNKRARLVVEGKDVLVPPRLAKVLPSVLTHIVRNAVAHGVEPPMEREKSGKPDVGEISLRCRENGELDPIIEIEDDGRGLALEAIEARAREVGAWKEGSRPEEIVFAARFSTSPSPREASGLGVGLTSVRADARAAGYSVTLERRAPFGTRFVLSPKEIA